MSTSDLPAPWKAIAQRKQAEREARIPKEWRLHPRFLHIDGSKLDVPRTCGILNPREITITESYDAVALAAAISNRTYNSEEVAIAFCKRAAIAQQLSNCLTEIMFEDAITRGKWLDSELKRTGKIIGPFHGLPISLKDTFKVKNYDASIGIASLCFDPAMENSELVTTLSDLGAVFYCKTNIPQTLMSLDSHNNVFGRTINPRNPLVTAGGSSGGEGALLALRGSILGVGTDIGGSIRVPAQCNGIYGVKPSAQRIPYIGQQSAARPGIGNLSLKSSAGPMGLSVRDCEFFLKAVSDSRPWERDPAVIFGDWTYQGSLSEKPVIGVLRTDGVVSPLPPVAAVLEETVQALRREGVEVVEIEAPEFSKCQAIMNKLFGVDGGNFVSDLLEKTGEPLSPWLQDKFRKRAQMPINTLAEAHAEKGELEKTMLGLWRDEKGRQVDAIICPVAPHPTPGIDRWGLAGYTGSFVVLDWPAGTIPVRDFIKSDNQREFSSEEGSGHWDNVNRKLCESTLQFLSTSTRSCILSRCIVSPTNTE
jgi:amidase